MTSANTINETRCLNCNAIVNGNFCSNCGQRKEVSKLTWNSLVYELLHFFSHIEKSFINTSFKLLIRPEIVIGEYLKGKRIKYFKPLSLFLIWVTIHLLIYQFTVSIMGYKNLRTDVEVGTYIVKHTALFGLLLFPILSIALWLIVARSKLNYIETFIVILYSFAAVEILISLQIMIKGLLFRANFLTNNFPLQVKIVSVIWALYCFTMLFRHQKIKFLIPRILVCLVIGILVNTKLTPIVANLIFKY